MIFQTTVPQNSDHHNHAEGFQGLTGAPTSEPDHFSLFSACHLADWAVM